MKFPVSVFAKKHPYRKSLSEENDKNNENLIDSSERKEPSSLLQIPKLLQTATSPEIICDRDKEKMGGANEMSMDGHPLKRRPSQEDEGVDNCDHYEIDDEEAETETDVCETRTRLFRSGSLYDDSGFNSSASEDKDDILDTLNVIYDCDTDGDDEDEEKKFRSSSSLLKRDSGISIPEETISERLSPILINTSEHSTTSEAKVKQQSHSIFKNISPKNVGLVGLRSVGGGNVIPRHSLRINSRKQRTDVSNSVSVTSRTTAVPRSRILRRRRTQDLNNNDTGPNVYSYLGKPPFKLGDCFKDQGLLSLVACIIYTLILVCICSAFGLALDICKSLIGKREIKEMRENIITARRRRSTVTLG